MIATDDSAPPDADRSAMTGPPAGLCEHCRHRQLVPNTRGSVFWLCRRSRTEPERFPRYPRLPVLRCDGYERSAGATELAPAG